MSTDNTRLAIIAAYTVFPKAKGLIFICSSGDKYNVPIKRNLEALEQLVLDGNHVTFKKTEEPKPINHVQTMIPVDRKFNNTQDMNANLLILSF